MSAARLTRGQRPHFVGAPVLLASLLIVGVLTAVFRLALHGAVQPNAAVAFGIVVAAGETLRITLPGGRDNAPLAATAALGYALAPQLCGHPAQWGPVQVIVVVAVAAALGSVPQALVGRPPSVGYLVRRIGVPGFVAWLLRSVLHSVVERTVGSGLLLLLCGMACLALLLDSALAALFGKSAGQYASGLVSPGGEFEFGDPSSSLGIAPQPLLVSKEAQFGAGAERVTSRALRRFFGNWFDECMATARVCPAVAALSAAVALAAGPLGLWVLPIAAAPVLVMQRALRRYAAIRATYQQTIRALSRVTDLAGYTEPGHARRVCRLALAIGRELDLTEPELLDLEYASLLHDIGQLSLADPLPSGATVLATPWVAAAVAVRGAEVVRQTGVLDRVARVLEAQVMPYQATHLGPPRPPTGPEKVTEAATEAAAGVAAAAAPEAVTAVATEAAPGSAVVSGSTSESASTSSSGAGEVPGSVDSGADSGAEPGTEPDGWVPPDASELRAAGILRVANDFEDLRTAEPGPAANARALARIRRGVGAPYDPSAVEALTRLFAPQ